MPAWQSFSFLFGPMLAVAVLVAIVFLLRWTFSHGGSLVRHSGAPGEPTDYGLLVPVDAPPSYEAAVAVQEQLRSIGIHSTITQTTRGLRVLVWPAQADPARAVVRRLRGPAA